MSDVFYPLSLIETLKPTKYGRVIADPFEDGTEAARNTWSAQNFKRKFSIQHTYLTFAEYRYLRSFWSQRSGRYDTFWFRDNVHREGNAQVRFAMDLQPQFSGSARRVAVDLEEVAPIRALPEWDEVTTAAGAAPFVWYDACREMWYQHLGVTYRPEALRDELGNYSAAWQAGALNLGGSVAQYQYYTLTGAEWARTSGNVAELTAPTPAATVFLIGRFSAIAALDHYLVQVGAGTDPIGIVLNSGSAFGTPGASWTSWFTNPNPDAWQSVSLTFAAGGASRKLYLNGVLKATDTHATTWAAGKISIGASVTGTNIANAGNALTNCNIAHVLVFASALSLAQVKALHNLLGYQFALATV